MTNFFPMTLGRLIPRLGEDSVDISLNVLIFTLGPFDSLIFCGWPVLLVCYNPGNVFPCYFFPYLEMYYYNYSV